jgi:hypothetical protein
LTVPDAAWVEKGRSGRRNTWVLTQRGRAIVERSVPAHLRGEGSYEGLAPWRESSKARRQQEFLAVRIQAMQLDHDGRELLARIECAMFAWSCFLGPTSAGLRVGVRADGGAGGAAGAECVISELSGLVAILFL